MRRIAKLLASLPLEERKKLSGVGPRRAEIIVAGAAVYTELLERCQLPGFRYSSLGLRDGLRRTVEWFVGSANGIGRQSISLSVNDAR